MAKAKLTGTRMKLLLAEEIEMIQSRKTTPAKTNSIVSTVEAYLNVFRTQMRATEITGQTADFSDLLQ